VPSLGRATFFAGAGALVVPLVVGGLAALDFDRAFVIFHHIFFPGKDNWMFDPRTDAIILVLPQQFFMNCAILIGVGLVTFSLILMWLGRRRKT
jgi:integral membrane protein (TIGR01906 family)